MALDFTELDDRIAKLQAILDVLLPTLVGHGTHVFFHSGQDFYSQSIDQADSSFPSLSSDDKVIAVRLLDFHRRFYFNE